MREVGGAEFNQLRGISKLTARFFGHRAGLQYSKKYVAKGGG